MVVLAAARGEADEAFDRARQMLDLYQNMLEEGHPWLQWFRLFLLDNPQPNLSIAVALGTDEEGFPLFEAQEVEVNEGFACIVENRARQDLYVTIFELAVDGRVEILFPQKGTGKLLGSGQRLNPVFYTRVPEDRQSIKDVIKVIATTTPVDFLFFMQAGIGKIRSRSRIYSNLLRGVLQESEKAGGISLNLFFADLLQGRPSKDASELENEWVTVQKVLEVRRAPEAVKK